MRGEVGRRIAVRCWRWMLLILVWVALAGQLRAQLTTPDFFVDVAVDNPTPYRGQQVVYTARLFMAQPTQFIYEAPDFRDFWRAGQLTRTGVELRQGRQFTVVTSEIVLLPTADGALTIRPSVYIIPASVLSDRARLELLTDSVEVIVQPFPTGAPSSFAGAVGQLDMQVVVDEQTVRLGEPVTLRARVSGIGNLELIGPLTLNAPEGWRIYPNPANTVIVTSAGEGRAQLTGTRTFEWRLIPERAGSHAFAPVEFSYLDPQEGVYRTIATQPFTMEVLSGEDGLRELPSLASANDGLPALPLLPPPTTISEGRAVPDAGFWLLWLLPPAFVAAVWGAIQWRAWRERARAARRHAVALSRARRALQEAARAGATGHAQIKAAILNYCADKLNRDSLTLGEAIFALRGLKADTALIERAVGCANRAEDGRFAPEGWLSPAGLASETYEALAALDAFWAAPDDAQDGGQAVADAGLRTV